MAPRILLTATALASALPLSGCATTGEFPSLAVRDVELDRSTEAPVRPPIEIASDPALRQRIEQLVAQARAGQSAFETAHPPALAATAAAGSQDSESWVVAQQALSRLEAARVDTTSALSDLDQVSLQRAAVPTSRDDLIALNAAIAAVQALALEQQRRFDALRGRLSRR